MISVTKEEFYKYIGQRDIVVSSQREVTRFETRERLLVGETEGYMVTSDVAGPFYRLTEAAYEELKGQQ